MKQPKVREGKHSRSRDRALPTRSQTNGVNVNPSSPPLPHLRLLRDQTTRLSRYPLCAAASTFPSSRRRFHPSCRVPTSVTENFPSSNTSSNPSSRAYPSVRYLQVHTWRAAAPREISPINRSVLFSGALETPGCCTRTLRTAGLLEHKYAGRPKSSITRRIYHCEHRGSGDTRR